jgi:tetratricopeptide (TPR) repeat protein
MIEALQQEFPRNRLLWLEAGTAELRAGRLTDARRSLEEGMARLERDLRPRAFGEEARWKLAHGSVLIALKAFAPADRELREAALEPARDWVHGRIHCELGKLADAAADRSRALAEYRLAVPLCEHDHDSACSDEARRLMKTRYR